MVMVQLIKDSFLKQATLLDFGNCQWSTFVKIILMEWEHLKIELPTTQTSTLEETRFQVSKLRLRMFSWFVRLLNGLVNSFKNMDLSSLKLSHTDITAIQCLIQESPTEIRVRFKRLELQEILSKFSRIWLLSKSGPLLKSSNKWKRTSVRS